MNKILKSPNDQFNIFFIFDGDMEPDETVTGWTVYSGNVTTGEISTDSIVGASSLVGQQIEVVLLAGQISGEMHKITAVIYTSANQIYEKDVAVFIHEISLGCFKKQSSEKFLIFVDFSPHLDSDETIDFTSVSVSAVSGEDGSDVTSSIISGSGEGASGSQGVAVEVYGGSNGGTYIISVNITCVDAVLALAKTVQRTVMMNVADDSYYGTLEWDYDRSDSVVLPSSTANVYVAGAGGPFTWSITGTGFTLGEDTTVGLGNTVIGSDVVVGDAEITITNRYGQTVVHQFGTTRPVAIDGLVAWWDASDQSTVFTASGDPVSIDDDTVHQITDKSGNGYNLIHDGFVPMAVFHPALELMGGQSGLEFTHDAISGISPKYTITPAITHAADSMVVFAAIDTTSLGGGYQYLMGGGTYPESLDIAIGGLNGANWYKSFVRWGLYGYSSGASQIARPAIMRWSLLDGGAPPATVEIGVDSNPAVVAGGVSSPPISEWEWLGTAPISSQTYAGSFNVAEILIFQGHAFTDEEELLVVEYLNSKYGVY